MRTERGPLRFSVGDRGGGEFNERVGEEGRALRGTSEFTQSVKEMH